MTTNTENTNTAPVSFDFNETDTRRPAPKQLTDAMYEGAITAATRRTCPYNDSNDIGIEVTCTPVDKEGNLQRQYRATKWYGIPVSNPEVPGHKVSTEEREWQGKPMPSDRDNYFQGCRELMRAVLGDDTGLPAFPKWVAERKCHIDPTTGETMTKTEKYAREEEINKLTLTKIREWYVNPETLVNTKVFFKTKRNAKGFAACKYTRHDPGKEDVRYEDFTSEE